MKSKNIENVFLKLLNNKISLYLVSLIAILVIINNLMNNNFITVFIFYIIAGIVFLYTKNMTLIFLVSLIGSCIYSNYKNVIFKEGFKENQDSMEENPDNLEEYDEDLEDSYIDPQEDINNDDYSSDSNSEYDYDTDNEEDFESLKNKKMYEGYSGRDKQLDKNTQILLNGARAEHNGYVDNSPPPGYDEIATSIWTKLKKPINFANSNINPTAGRVANGDFLSESANIKEITNRLEGFKGFEGFKEGTSRPYLNTINNATIGGNSYPGGVGSSPEVKRYKKHMTAIEESKKNYKNIEGFKEGASHTGGIGLSVDKTYLKSQAKEKAKIKAKEMSRAGSLEKLENDFKKSALTVEKSKQRSGATQARANALKKNIQAGMDIRYGEAKFNRKGFKNKDTKEEYVNNKPLDYSKIKHKKPINTRPKKTLTKGDEMEAAYDNFEKIMGGDNINSLGDTTKGLISKQKELLNGIKDMTPVINEAMGVLNKFDIGSILGGIKK